MLSPMTWPVTIATRLSLASGSVRLSFFGGLLSSLLCLSAVALPPTEPLHRSSRRTGMVISEIMYRPSDPALAYVELFNSAPIAEDIGGWRLKGAVSFTFEAPMVVPAGGFLVVAADPPGLQSAYGLSGVLGPYDGSLDRDEGDLLLFDERGGLMLEAEYAAAFPWPAAAAGAGHSLVLARPSYGEGNIEAWAASAWKGGSPGAHEPEGVDPLDAVVINEFLAHTDEPLVDFVELYNTGTQPVDLSGAWLSDRLTTNRFAIPPGTVIPPGGFLSYEEGELGFALAAAGEAVVLVNSNDTRVIDAIVFGGQANAISMGRYPDGAPEFALLETPTPNAPNSGLYTSPIVINEIMFNPISGDDADTYVELLNRSENPVDLGNWRLVDGISFTIPDGTELPAGGYLVIAKDRDRLIERYPQLHAGNTLGNFGGRLANSGERLALAMPSFRGDGSVDHVVVDDVHYRDGGRWGDWANRDGSSLELRDPRSDNRRAANWTHSDESARSEWVLIEHTGVLDHGSGPANQLHLLMPSGGDVLIDDVEVRIGDGPNLVPNSDFETEFFGWVAHGNHIRTHWHTTEGYESSRSMRVRATGGGDTGANRVRITLTESLSSGQTVTLRARARWLAGHDLILLRVKGNYLEAPGHLHVPPDLGTPGLPNSALESNVGPAIFDVRHHPARPAAFEPVTITARAHDPDGVANMTLFARIDPSTTYSAIPMTFDQGTYRAQLPGHPNGTLMAYYIEGTDGHAVPASATYPDDPTDYEALIRFGLAQQPGVLKTYHLLFTQATINEWEGRPRLSNERLRGTLVYGDRVIHGIGARFRGSPFRRAWGASGYSFQTPRDDRLLGAREFSLNAIPSDDNTGQREFLGYWIARQLGLPTPHTTFIHVRVNGAQPSLPGMSDVFTDVHHIHSDYVRKWFPDDDGGQMFKGDDWFEFRDDFSFKFHVNARLQEYRTTGNALKQARYRWIWNKRSNRWLDDDYGPFFELVEAVNSPPSEYAAAVESLVDIEQWMRVFAARRAVSEWDGYGYERGKDAWLYKPDRDRWKMLLWDLDKGLGAWSDAEAQLFDKVEDPTAQRMYDHPAYRRTYLQAIQEAITGPMTASRINPLMDEVRDALNANGISVSGTWGIKSWLNTRRNSVTDSLAEEDTDVFALDAAQPSGPWSAPLYTLAGTAPLAVRSITVNGIAYPLTWSSATEWSIALPLQPGPSTLVVEAWDLAGDPIGSDQVAVTYTGPAPTPVEDLVINEIMYDPAATGTEFVEIYNASSTHPYDLTGFRLRGVDFDFPPGTIIDPDAYLLVVRNEWAVRDLYGVGLPIAGEYNGTLQPTGERLRLVRLATETEPELIVDEVTYSASFPWPSGAQGTGKSIQRINPHHDSNDPANWSVAIDAADTSWQLVSMTGVGSGQFQGTRIYLYLNGAGEVHIDDIRLEPGFERGQGPNLLVNGGFEQPLAGTWAVGQHHEQSAIVSNVQKSGEASLHIVATASGSGFSDSISQVDMPIVDGEPYTLSYWYLPNTNGAPLTARLRYSAPQFTENGVSITHDTQPQLFDPATPGRANSVPSNLREIPPMSLLHYWNFNDTDALLSATYTVGDGALAAIPAPGGAVTFGDGQDFEGANARFGHAAETHLRMNDPIGANLNLALPTTGYTNIVLRYETRRSGQGAGLQQIAYTTNGLDYVNFAQIAPTTSPVVYSFLFDEVPGTMNNPLFGVRVTFEEGEGGTAGNNRFDNITLDGTPMDGVNSPPFPTAEVPLQRAIEGAEPLILDLATLFADPDGDPLSFTAASDLPGMALPVVSNQTLHVYPLTRGEAQIMVEADDGHHPPVPISFRLLIYPAPHRLVTGPLTFSEWDPDLPERTYPEHMLFLQTDLSDTALDSPLDFAYYIAHDQYHANDQSTIGLPYNNTGRSRINGLGENGIAFINTGQDRDLGGLLAAVDTRHLDDPTIEWLAGTVLPNSRIYAIRLQYRVGIDGPFVDLLDENEQIVEYMRNPVAGHTQPMPAVDLPVDALDQPYVQLLWRYYRVSGSSGPRAQLRLDDMVVEAEPRVTTATGTPHWWLADQGLTEPFETSAMTIIGVHDRPAWEYYTARVDPSDVSAPWPELSISMDGPQARIEFAPTYPDRQYAIQRREPFASGGWLTLTNNAGTGGAWTIPFEPELPLHFFRGSISLPEDSP